MPTGLALFIPLALSVATWAQKSTYIAPGVPSDAPLPGNYTGAYRPQIHYSAPQHFLNDPNGMFLDANGTYHLYYQYDPLENVPGHVHWGHTTSRDLYHWENQKIAIFPTSNDTQIFSGSAVVDVNNTSGFFPDQDNGVVAFYTLAYTSSGLQEQAIAYSHDGGYTFLQYSGNPIINLNSTAFRDPKVVWYAPTQKWIMVLSFASDYAIGIYTSSNLRDWDLASNFSHHGLLGQQYECPNLVEIPMKGASDPMWLLLISINPGAPLGGSITEYFPGTFNGTHFTAVDDAARIADFAKDNYAGQFFYGVPGDQNQISIAWASNWQYTAMIGYDLVSTPYNISSIFTQELARNDSIGNDTVLLSYAKVPSGAIYFEANVTGLPTATANLTGSVSFTFTSSISRESVQGGTFIGGDTWISRQHIYGFENPFFTDKFSVTGQNSGEGTWAVSGVIDRTIFEVFVNGGQESGTMVFYPTSPLDQMSIGAAKIPTGANVSVAVYALDDAWARYEDANRTVAGNVTVKV
ncbi:MAG: hypothetical protein M1820_008673 [Bogoriella megaspora]|nr:MAG: hypothetical protein M1820_008673 [Bogoriella megaspora]